MWARCSCSRYLPFVPLSIVLVLHILTDPAPFPSGILKLALHLHNASCTPHAPISSSDNPPIHLTSSDLSGHTHQIVPTASNGADAVNFRQMQESTSLHLERQHASPSIQPQVPGTPGLSGGDDGLDVPPADADLFGAFSSITLHYDGENYD